MVKRSAWTVGALTTFALACCAASSSAGTEQYAVSDDDAGAKVRGTVLSLDELKRRCQFDPLVPIVMPEGYALTQTQIAWVVKTPDQPGIPSHQVVRFIYRRDGYPPINLLEARWISGASVWSVQSEGYFRDWYQGDGLSAVSAQKDGVDFVLISSPPITTDTLDQMRRVPWVSPSERQEGPGDAATKWKPLPILPEPSVGGSGAEDEGALWPGKRITLDELPTRCDFAPLLPNWIPQGYELAVTEIVWVVHDPAEPKLPSRPAVRFVYERKGEPGGISVIETKHIPELWYRNVSWILGQGYFASFCKDGRNIPAWGTVDGIDFLTVSYLQLDNDRLRDARQWRPLSTPTSQVRRQ